MNYHLNRDRQDLGIFPLEELRRRRATGELTGVELVWCAGMANWQPLDSVLQPGISKVPPPPPLAPMVAPKSNFLVPVVVILVALFLVGMCILAGLLSKTMVLQAGKVFQEVSDGTAGKSDAMAAATKPVLVDSNSLTATQVTERTQEFKKRQFVTGFQERGEHNPATDAAALKLLEKWVVSNDNNALNTNSAELEELADRVTTNPAEADPIVLCAAGDIATELHSSTNRLGRALKGFENSHHLGYPKFYAAMHLGNQIFGNREMQLPTLDALAVKYFQAALADGSINPEDQMVIAELLIEGRGKTFFNRNGKDIIRLVREKGEAFSWLALVLEGQWEINEAWLARGDGYSDNVAESGWQGFHSHLASARKALTSAWQLQPNRPQAPALMMTVALGDSNIGEMRQWFDRTVTAQFDYLSAWQSMRWGLRPRWYGSEQAMMAFGVTALNTRRFDTCVPYEYFKSINDIGSEHDHAPGEHNYGRADIWPNLKVMFEGYVAGTRDNEQILWRGNYAAVAYLSRHLDAAREQLIALGWQPDAASLNGWDCDLSLLAPEVAARTGTHSIMVNRAENYRQQDDFDGALKIYHELATASLEPPERKFVEDRLLSLDTERHLAAGEWVNFLPTSNDFVGWQLQRGQCQVQPDGALQVHTDISGNLIYSRVRVGNDFEVRGQFELVHSTDQQFQGGLVVGIPQFDTDNWYGFRIKRTTADGDTANYAQHWTLRQWMVPAPINAGTNTFWFSFHNGRVTASVNGREVFHNVAPPKDSDVVLHDCRLGFGSYHDSNITDIRYRNVQVHLPAADGTQ